MVARILSAGVIVLNWHRDHYRYLLLRAYNYWDFPKGMVESGESPLEAAVREVEEETTITELNFRWGQCFCETKPYNHGRKVARYYLAQTPNTRIHLPVNPELGRPEHSEYRWVTRQQAWKMVTPRVQAVLVWADGVIGSRNKRCR
jgi:bis(5'-nucleosidyl)-tetraphosphatase